MKTITTLLLLAVVAAPASAQFTRGNLRMMPGVTQNVTPAAGTTYNLTPSVVNGQVIPSVTYPQQYSTYSTGNQVVGGSVMTNGSMQQPYTLNNGVPTTTYSQPFNSTPTTYVRGSDGQLYPQANSTIYSQPSNNSTIYSQPMNNGVTYSQPYTSYTTPSNYTQPYTSGQPVYTQPYTSYTTRGFTSGGSMVGSQNNLFRTTTNTVGNVVRTPFRVIRGAFR